MSGHVIGREQTDKADSDRRSSVKDRACDIMCVIDRVYLQWVGTCSPVQRLSDGNRPGVSLLECLQARLEASIEVLSL